ncbi:MAG: hypothetical protein H0W84_09995 [Bacteroidetes bacterium]|nr:hypothetical protein [Bacteroidota bacterium]
MKNVYIILYSLSGIIFLSALLGNSLTKPMFESLSEKTLESTGFKKSYLESVDDRIDELVYKSKQIEFQIEKLKKFFSSDKVDESKYQKDKSAMLEKTFYDPLIGLFSIVYRLIFIFLALIILSFAVIFHITYRSFDLRRRVKRLEERVAAGSI